MTDSSAHRTVPSLSHWVNGYRDLGSVFADAVREDGIQGGFSIFPFMVFFGALFTVLYPFALAYKWVRGE